MIRFLAACLSLGVTVGLMIGANREHHPCPDIELSMNYDKSAAELGAMYVIGCR